MFMLNTLALSHSVSLDMLNNFRFMSMLKTLSVKAENCNAFFLTTLLEAPSPVSLEFIELVPS